MDSCRCDDPMPVTDPHISIKDLARHFETTPERVVELVSEDWTAQRLGDLADALLGQPRPSPR